MQLVTLLTSIWLLCGVYGNMVNLIPSPESLVIEGKTLDLQCNYIGSSIPDFINWYLNGDTVGLVIDAKDCKYKITQKPYETDRLKTSCNITSSTLSIVDILVTKDDSAKWECDYTIMDGEPHGKASTTIRVIDSAHDLQCIRCDSVQYPKCAETFGYSAEEAKNLNISKPCPIIMQRNGSMSLESAVCKKKISNMPGAYGNIITRTCDKPVKGIDSTFNACKKYRGLTVCYCTTDNCNQQSHILMSLPLLLSSLLSGRVIQF